MCLTIKQLSTMVRFQYNDGGCHKYFKGRVGDCVVRAFAIATNIDYKEVYNMAKFLCGKGDSPRNGMDKRNTRKLAEQLGFKWHPCMKIGTGCTTHLVAEELPKGNIVCSCSGHVAVINGVINDTYDSTRNGKRCVYGYWYKD